MLSPVELTVGHFSSEKLDHTTATSESASCVLQLTLLLLTVTKLSMELWLFQRASNPAAKWVKTAIIANDAMVRTQLNSIGSIVDDEIETTARKIQAPDNAKKALHSAISDMYHCFKTRRASPTKIAASSTDRTTPRDMNKLHGTESAYSVMSWQNPAYCRPAEKIQNKVEKTRLSRYRR